MPSLSDFHFALPDELVAQRPLVNRTDSRMLVVNRTRLSWEHREFREFPEFCRSGDCVVANASRVIPARLKGHRIEGGSGKVEFFLLKPLTPLRWLGIMSSTAKQKPGFKMEFGVSRSGERLMATLISKDESDGTVQAEFSEDPLASGLGSIPLPPYVERAPLPEIEGQDRYQTVFSKDLGSVAAPTAGLHFTRETIAKLQSKGVAWSEIILHVGLGTFRPIKTKKIEDHLMHEEEFFIPPRAKNEIEDAKKKGKRVIAVGTTSLRSLESAWNPGIQALTEGWGSTRLYLYPGGPGLPLSCADSLLTNFHIPESSLFVLVCAFLGTDFAKAVYQEAIAQKYRFYSYGDCMLIL